MENTDNNPANVTSTKPAFVMVQMKVKSLEDLNQRYATFVFPILHKYEGQMIAGSATPTVKEGDWDGNWAAVLRFPSMEAAENWYNAEEYKPYKDLRKNEMQLEEGSVVMIQGF